MNKRPLLAPDDAIDLQIHTIFSDGAWTPRALVEHVRSRGFRLIAVTDHDTTAGSDDLRRLGADAGVLVVAGVEATASWRGQVAHVLCYAPDAIGEPLLDLVAGTVRRMEVNTAAVFGELEHRGYRFPSKAAVLPATEGQPQRPADNATLLVAHGYAPNMDSAIAMIGEAGYRIAAAPLNDVVTAAHASGALAMLAHPGRGGGEIREYPPDLLRALLDENNLDGIEVYYPLHTSEQVAAYARLAEERSLLISAGSDSHGPDRRLPAAYPASDVRHLLARLGVDVAAG